jgi:hypothetical protein
MKLTQNEARGESITAGLASLHLQLIISKFYNSAKFCTKNRKGAS